MTITEDRPTEKVLGKATSPLKVPAKGTTTLKVTAKGQITLKRDVLRHLGVGPGDQVEVTLLPQGQVRVMAPQPKGSIEDLFGMFKDKVTRVVSIEEMNQVIADGWAGLLP